MIKAISLIRQFEGFRTEPYDDLGVSAIGYGHRLLPGENLTSLTREEAEALLLKDLEPRAKFIRDKVTIPLTDNQFAALLDFVYNVGTGAFAGSTLLELLNKGNYAGAADELLKWHHVTINGTKQDSPALMRRREAERALFTEGNMGELRIERYNGAGDYFRYDEKASERVAETGWSGVWVQVFDENDKPLTGVFAEHFWPQPPTLDGSERVEVVLKSNGAEVQPIAEFILDPRTSGFDARGYGPHNFRMVGNSDVVYSCGTEGNRHFQYRLIFKRVKAGAPQEPPEPPPSGNYVTRAEYEALQAELRGLRNIIASAFALAGEKVLRG